MKKRENFDATTEREIISIQNNCFFDVANEIKENEISKIDFDWLINDVNINVDSFDEKIVVDANIAIDINIAISFDVNSANFAFDVKRNVNVNFDVFDVRFAIIHEQIKE